MESNATIIQLIIEMDDKDVIGLCVPELSDFINSGFGDLKSKSKKKILTLATKNSHTLHREIDDNAVVNWKFDLFMEFVNILTSKGSSQSEKSRTRLLLIKGRHLIREIKAACAKVRKNHDYLSFRNLSNIFYYALRDGENGRLKEEFQEYFYLLSQNLSQPRSDGTWFTDKDSIRICMDLLMCVQLITTHLGTDPFVEFLKHKDEYSDEEGRNKHLGRVFQSLIIL